jgi:hypothetical protein
MEAKHTCDNCGLPSWAISGTGVSITIEDRPENSFQRTRKRTAWCHSAECAVQALAVSRFGRASHKWPITLAQFRAMQPREQPPTGTSKRVRPSRKAKDLVWAMPTAKDGEPSPLESMA